MPRNHALETSLRASNESPEIDINLQQNFVIVRWPRAVGVDPLHRETTTSLMERASLSQLDAGGVTGWQGLIAARGGNPGFVLQAKNFGSSI